MSLIAAGTRIVLANICALAVLTGCRTGSSSATKTVGVVDQSGKTQLIFRTQGDEIVWVDCKKSITANDGNTAVATCLGNT